jgi:hypothetical protein
VATIAFDIEVAGIPWDEIDDATREYLLGRASDAEAREGIPNRTALFPGLGKVIAIGLWLLEQDRGLVLLEGDSTPERAWERVLATKIVRGSEQEILTRFWKVVAKPSARSRAPRLVTYNGRSYDGPTLMIRSAQLGVRVSRHLVPYRYDVAEHCDLMDVLGFMGAVRGLQPLDYWCRRFGIESPKHGLDGSKVAAAYAAGRIEEIGEYCLRDVKATAELFARIQSTFLPVFPGGR